MERLKTLWEHEWPQIANGASLSVERASTLLVDDAGREVAATQTLVLVLLGRRSDRFRMAHVCAVHRDRILLGVGALIGGKLRARWRPGFRTAQS